MAELIVAEKRIGDASNINLKQWRVRFPPPSITWFTRFRQQHSTMNNSVTSDTPCDKVAKLSLSTCYQKIFRVTGRARTMVPFWPPELALLKLQLSWWCGSDPYHPHFSTIRRYQKSQGHLGESIRKPSSCLMNPML